LPPVALEGSELELPPVAPLEAPELAASVAEPAPEPLEASVPASPDCSFAPVSLEPVVELELVVDVEVVAVVVVEVPCVASLSAWVLLGGVISGVLRGATSAELPLLPQAPSVRPARSAAAPARTAARDLTSAAGPSVGRRWGSR
jgi:hypothetical protein